MSVLTHDFVIARPPGTDAELYELVQTLWGVTIPWTRVCADHQTPFDAFADAFFARSPVSVWKGSRGFGGKSRTLAYLALTEAVIYGADISLLGASENQSKNVHDAMYEGWDSALAPRHMLAHFGPSEMRLTNKARVRPLTASQKTVRGPHPQRLRLDEIDEMDLAILDAAMGQPMPGRGIDSQTVMSSTHQYPDKTMYEILQRAVENDWPVFTWCIAKDSLILTARGEVPIQEVTDQDLVMTRKGWRHVQHVTFMGYKPTLALKINNRVLRCTSDHRIATPDGWSHASTLATNAVTTIRPNPSVFRRELVPSAAVGSSSLVRFGSTLVFTVGDSVQVLDVEANSISAQMIQSQSSGYRTNDLLPYPSVSISTGPALAISLSNSLDAVSSAFCSWPVDALSGEHRDIMPVFDIGVEGDTHEFVADGVVVHNCYKETSNPIDGWLAPETIERKKQETSAQMFAIEYDLQEPSLGTRAMDTDAVEKMFSGGEKTKDGRIEIVASPSMRKGGAMEFHRFEEYQRNCDYVIAADWAKEQDFTVISVWKTNTKPWELVAYKRGNRRPWPTMVGWYNELFNEYSCYRAIHDGTGVGNVVNDYIDSRSTPFMMVGRDRDEMLTEYIAAVERGEFIAPRIESAYTAHKYASVESIYSRNKDEHLADEICSFALAWHTAHRKRPRALPINVGRLTANGETEVKTSPWRDVGGNTEHPAPSSTFNLSV